MDEEQPTSETVIEPTPVEVPAEEPKRGRILATYLVRVTLRERSDDALSPPVDVEPDIPTNVLMAQIVEEGIYVSTSYFQRDEINATSERV